MSQKIRIMVIEDDPKTIELHGFLLKQGGYEPLLAQGGLEGLRLLRENSVDLILLDLLLDDVDGWTVLRTLKADDRWQAIPVLIVSARHPFEDPGQTMAHAELFENYLVKPFIVHDLLMQIESALGRSVPVPYLSWKAAMGGAGVAWTSRSPKMRSCVRRV
jgi:DNA-binding response OmpR family regulator